VLQLDVVRTAASS